MGYDGSNYFDKKPEKAVPSLHWLLRWGKVILWPLFGGTAAGRWYRITFKVAFVGVGVLCTASFLFGTREWPTLFLLSLLIYVLGIFITVIDQGL
jgi:hypothetical protein